VKFEPDQLADFLRELREEYGFSIGVRERLRAELLRHLLGEDSEALNVDGWAMHIAPVVCGSHEEQRTLRFALRHYEESGKLAAKRLGTAAEHSVASGSGTNSESQSPTWYRPHNLFWLGAMLIGIAVVLITLWYFSARPRTAPGEGVQQPNISYMPCAQFRFAGGAIIGNIIALAVVGAIHPLASRSAARIPAFLGAVGRQR
jgi:hypothetical protein